MQFTFIEKAQQYPFRGSHVKTFQKAGFILIVPMRGTASANSNYCSAYRQTGTKAGDRISFQF
jgi:hypothetical protein